MKVQTTDEISVSLDKSYSLPPLILHPFAEPTGPQKLTQSSRANLMIQGLLPAGQASASDLQRALLDGRFSELRMLYYVGKDVQRWIEQSIEFLQRSQGALPEGVLPQSFASLLIEDTPPNISEKLKRWGVNDFKSIFSRGLGLNAMFAQAPTPELLSEDFIRSYFRFADHLYLAYLGQGGHTRLGSERFQFDLYSSGEYSRMLERSWE
jgi:hypothetical protein